MGDLEYVTNAHTYHERAITWTRRAGARLWDQDLAWKDCARNAYWTLVGREERTRIEHIWGLNRQFADSVKHDVNRAFPTKEPSVEKAHLGLSMLNDRNRFACQKMLSDAIGHFLQLVLEYKNNIK